MTEGAAGEGSWQSQQQELCCWRMRGVWGAVWPGGLAQLMGAQGWQGQQEKVALGKQSGAGLQGTAAARDINRAISYPEMGKEQNVCCCDFQCHFFDYRHHLPSELEWPKDEEISRERHVCPEPPFSPFPSGCLTRFISTAFCVGLHGCTASGRALWGWEPRLCKAAHPCRLLNTW